MSDKAAYRNYQIRLLSEVSVTIRTLAEKKNKKMIGVLKNCKKDQKFIFSNYQNIYEIKEQWIGFLTPLEIIAAFQHKKRKINKYITF